MATLPFDVGDRIELVSMPNDPDPIPVGTTGTVERIQDLDSRGNFHVSVRWDINRSLSLCIPPDVARKLNP